MTGQIIVLNGTPRSGKSSIAAVIQESFEGVWMNLGVDRFKDATPERFQPGIGLRPGGEYPDLEQIIVDLYAAMYDSIAAHARRGINVVVDVDHHDWYSTPRGILPSCAGQLKGLDAWLVGVRCPIEVVMERRKATGWPVPEDGTIPEPVRRWQAAVHEPGVYDLEVDTSLNSPEECAELIGQRMQSGIPPDAFAKLRATSA